MTFFCSGRCATNKDYCATTGRTSCVTVSNYRLSANKRLAHRIFFPKTIGGCYFNFPGSSRHYRFE